MEPTLQRQDQPLDPRIQLSIKVVSVLFPWMFNGTNSMIFTADPRLSVAKVYIYLSTRILIMSLCSTFYIIQSRTWIRVKLFGAGGVYKKLLPKAEDFSHALYTFDIGQNDLTSGYFSNMTSSEVKAYVPDVLDQFKNIVSVSIFMHLLEVNFINCCCGDDKGEET